MLMKKIFALLLAALSVAFVACGDENTETRNDWFLTPEASADGTTVELTCLTRFGDGVLEGLDAGFSCAAVSGAESGQFVDYTDVTVDGNRLSARVSGLQPKTIYVFYAYADLPTGRTRSGGASFETGESSGPGPDPDPDTDLTKYTGWAELPAIQERPDDYYYTATVSRAAATIRSVTARICAAACGRHSRCTNVTGEIRTGRKSGTMIRSYPRRFSPI